MERRSVFHHASTGFVVSTIGLILLHMLFG